jgi:hypothetical protein
MASWHMQTMRIGTQTLREDRIHDELISTAIIHLMNIDLGYAVAQWLRHYATNRKVAGSILDEVNF